ncbi:MAG: MoxR family ATPase [Planctomycetota bacterium]
MSSADFLSHVSPGEDLKLPPLGAVPERVHVFDRDSILAVRAAHASRRPLLVRGEPGTGKSQLAHAVSVATSRVLVTHVVTGRTEPSDLLWRYDSVARLARAQSIGPRMTQGDPIDVDAEMAESEFVTPGPLWWAFDWASASDRAPEPQQYPGADADRGAILLIDEIDKADADVPNGLLEALGDGQFVPYGQPKPVCMSADRAPLVIVTTNEERALPDAFLRRCLVLRLELPNEREAFVTLLAERGALHCPKVDHQARRAAAEMLWEDRSVVRDAGLSPPGQAEYLDLLRALVALAPTKAKRADLLRELGRFTFRKHPREQVTYPAERAKDEAGA